MREGPIGPSPSSATRFPRPSETPFRSAPAQKQPSAPVSTAAASESSASKRRNAAASSVAVGPSTQLRTFGRSMVTIATGPSISKRTVGMAKSSCLLAYPRRMDAADLPFPPIWLVAALVTAAYSLLVVVWRRPHWVVDYPRVVLGGLGAVCL